MKELNKLALILRTLGFRAGTEEADDDCRAVGECIAQKDGYTWYIWKCATKEKYEVQLYAHDEIVYDGVMCGSLFDVVCTISTTYYE